MHWRRQPVPVVLVIIQVLYYFSPHKIKKNAAVGAFIQCFDIAGWTSKNIHSVKNLALKN